MHEIQTLLWPIINFLILVFGLIYLTKSNFIQFISNRHTQIKSDLEKVRIQLVNAEKEFSLYQEKLKNLDQEMRDLYSQSKVDMENAKLTILSNAKKMSDTIVADAKTSSETMVSDFKNKIKDDLIQQVLIKSETLIRTRLTGEDKERFRKDFSKQVEVRS